jgi:hypothetical protein
MDLFLLAASLLCLGAALASLLGGALWLADGDLLAMVLFTFAALSLLRASTEFGRWLHQRTLPPR